MILYTNIHSVIHFGDNRKTMMINMHGHLVCIFHYIPSYKRIWDESTFLGAVNSSSGWNEKWRELSEPLKERWVVGFPVLIQWFHFSQWSWCEIREKNCVFSLSYFFLFVCVIIAVVVDVAVDVYDCCWFGVCIWCGLVHVHFSSNVRCAQPFSFP